MTFFKDLLLGFTSFWKALKFIREHQLYWFMLIPAALMPGIYAIGTFVLKQPIDVDVDSVNDIIWFMLGQFFQISMALLFMKFTKYLVVILLSPLLTYLSERTERILVGNVYSFDFHQFVRDVKRALRITFRNLIWHYSLVMCAVLVVFVLWQEYEDLPISIVTMVVGFYYYGFSFVDYINERRKLTVEQSIKFMRKHRGLAFSIGVGYSLLILVPLNTDIVFGLNITKDGFLSGLGQFLYHIFLWICAAAAPVITIVASTIAMNDLVKLKRKH